MTYCKRIVLVTLALAIDGDFNTSAFSPIVPTIHDFSLGRRKFVTKIKSNSLPIVNIDTIKEVQPELGQDDLYIEAEPANNGKVPKVGEVMRMLPKETFKIDTKTGLFYFAVDFLAVVSSMGFLNAVVTSNLYHSFPVWAQAMTVAPLQLLTGFAMWCMWCIGHDAGHSTVSKSKKN